MPMKVQVEMTAEEFQEFISWRRNKEQYEEEIQSADGEMDYLYHKVLWSLEEDPKRPGKVKIAEQEHAAELVQMANEWFC